jgi:hypothetical protein
VKYIFSRSWLKDCSAIALLIKIFLLSDMKILLFDLIPSTSIKINTLNAWKLKTYLLINWLLVIIYFITVLGILWNIIITHIWSRKYWNMNLTIWMIDENKFLLPLDVYQSSCFVAHNINILYRGKIGVCYYYYKKSLNVNN